MRSARVLSGAAATRKRGPAGLSETMVARKGTGLPELKAALVDTPAEPYKTGGVMHVALSRVQEALAERENEAADD